MNIRSKVEAKNFKDVETGKVFYVDRVYRTDGYYIKLISGSDDRCSTNMFSDDLINAVRLNDGAKMVFKSTIKVFEIDSAELIV